MCVCVCDVGLSCGGMLTDVPVLLLVQSLTCHHGINLLKTPDVTHLPAISSPHTQQACKLMNTVHLDVSCHSWVDGRCLSTLSALPFSGLRELSFVSCDRLEALDLEVRTLEAIPLLLLTIIGCCRYAFKTIYNLYVPSFKAS